jgi:hypothetical protein
LSSCLLKKCDGGNAPQEAEQRQTRNNKWLPAPKRLVFEGYDWAKKLFRLVARTP